MLILASTSDLIQVVTSAGSGYAVKVQSVWLDNAAGVISPDRTNTASITTATTTTVVASPAASTQRNTKRLSIRNDHATDSCLVEVRHTDGTTVVTLWKGTLLASESVSLDEDGNWWRLGADGLPPAPTATGSLGIYRFTSSDTMVVSAGATCARVTASGAGGGGGGNYAGGGGGAVEANVVVPVTAGETATITIGAGGAGGASGSPGSDGGDTTFASTTSGTWTFAGAAGGEGVGGYGGFSNRNLRIKRATAASYASGTLQIGGVPGLGAGEPSPFFAGGTTSNGAGGGAGYRGPGANGGIFVAGDNAGANTGGGGGGGGNASAGGNGGSGYLDVEFFT